MGQFTLSIFTLFVLLVDSESQQYVFTHKTNFTKYFSLARCCSPYTSICIPNKLLILDSLKIFFSSEFVMCRSKLFMLALFVG